MATENEDVEAFSLMLPQKGLSDQNKNVHARGIKLKAHRERRQDKDCLLYDLDDVPPWHVILFYTFQVTPY